jgi:hypothetical protein
MESATMRFKYFYRGKISQKSGFYLISPFPLLPQNFYMVIKAAKTFAGLSNVVKVRIAGLNILQDLS